MNQKTEGWENKGMQAQNRSLTDWCARIRNGQMRLPRFQRFEAWDRQRICSLLGTVVNDLPLGITLILEVGDKEKFVSRFLETAPQCAGVVHEHLLDGQQRLTALWRAFHNNYESETYYVYLEEFDNYEGDRDRENMAVYCVSRYLNKNGERYPLWCDNSVHCLRRGLIPTHLLMPGDAQVQIDQWLDDATVDQKPKDDFEALERFLEMKKSVSDHIKDLRSTVANYNLPYLSLPPQTDKTLALQVFINMNTNSKPLSTYDIIVAEVESVVGESLHDLEQKLADEHPEIRRYAELADLILTTSALLQGHLPNQRGAWDMDKRLMVEQWSVMEHGLRRMADFLLAEGVFDERRLPTNAVLAPIAALFAAEIPTFGDKLGQDQLLLRRYLWSSFFTDRYENAAATRAFSDFNALKRVIRQEAKADGSRYTEADVPIFAEHAIAGSDELMAAEWPKRMSIRGRGILAVTCRLGASDFSTGEHVTAANINHRHYHHVFPDALLKEAEVKSYLALNCALISDKTNSSIGKKEPLQYLKDRYEWTTADIVGERLQSHLIPVEELANGGYEGMSEQAKVEKTRTDFEAFLRQRAQLVHQTVSQLTGGPQPSVPEVN